MTRSFSRAKKQLGGGNPAASWGSFAGVMADETVIVACKFDRPGEPLRAGAERGHKCRVCKRDIQITAYSLEILRERGPESVYTLCIPCTLHLSTLRQANGNGRSDLLTLSPSASEYVREHADVPKGADALLDLMREAFPNG